MFPSMTVTCQQSANLEAFRRFRRRGLLAALWAKMSGESPTLASFDCYAALTRQGRRYLGVQEIPVRQIIGSLGRSEDFDRGFRPLRKHLRERWAAALRLALIDRWPAIRVHKIGGQYFVEDGHHRVSVARYLDMVYILAEVWEYPQPAAPHRFSHSTRRSVDGLAVAE